jgi:hypothetical protein
MIFCKRFHNTRHIKRIDDCARLHSLDEKYNWKIVYKSHQKTMISKCTLYKWWSYWRTRAEIINSPDELCVNNDELDSGNQLPVLERGDFISFVIISEYRQKFHTYHQGKDDRNDNLITYRMNSHEGTREKNQYSSTTLLTVVCIRLSWEILAIHT